MINAASPGERASAGETDVFPIVGIRVTMMVNDCTPNIRALLL